MKNFELEKKAAEIRLDALMAIFKAGSGYVGSTMSVIEMIVALYYGELMGRPVMKHDPAKPGSKEQDYLIFSKGQAAPALYATLANRGFFSKDELNFMGQEASMLKLRPSSKVPGVFASMVAHGHGLSVGLGLALALKAERKDNKVFVILGDGELQNGQVWEAAMAAVHHKLNNLIVMIDHNKVQGDGVVRSVIDVGAIKDKFDAFGFQVVQALNGHNFDHLLNGLMRAFASNRKPVCMVCNTVCAKGVPFAEGKPYYRESSLSRGEIEEASNQLKKLM